MTTYEPLIAGLTPERLDLLSKLVRDKRHRPPAESDSPIARVVRAEQLPLSFAQERLWFIDQLEPESAAYNIPHAVRFTGSLQVPALEQSVNELVRRHEALRTNFVDVAGKPAQQIAPELKIELPLVDLRSLSETERRATAERLMHEQARRQFDLRRAPLLRVQLVRLDEREHEFLFAMHHIVSDGWSTGVLVREVGLLYPAFVSGEPSPLAELAIQYADFASWQRERLQGEVLDAELSYWKQQLADAPELLELPKDRVRSRLESFRGATQSFALSEQVSRGLRELSQQSGTTLFITVLAAFKALLYRYTGQTDIVVGTPVANRNRLQIEPLIGFFVNTLVLRTRVNGESSFGELLQQVRETVLGAQAHQELPFERLVQELAPERSLSHAPLFQVMLVFDTAGSRRLELPELELQTIGDYSGTAKFDLTLVLSNRESGELEGEIKYNAALFDETTIARLGQCFESILAAIVADVEQPLRNVPLLTTEQRRQLLTEWNDTQTDFGAPRCLDELLEIQVEKTPDAIALVYDDEQLTYAELNRRANQLAHHLRSLGVGPEVVVALLVERSALALIGIWGILKAGGGYVPLDVSMPAARVSAILTDARPAVLLTQSQLIPELVDVHPCVVLLDADWETIEQQSDESPRRLTTPDNVAYVIYTSGSTGQPKGVAVEHRQLVSYTRAIQDRLELRSGFSFALVSTFATDLGHTVIFPSLCTGGLLHVMSQERASDPSGLGEYFHRHPIDCLKIVPSHLSALLTVAHPERVLPRRRLVLGGEASSWQLIEKIFDLATSCAVFNHYGPTETTVGVLTYSLTPSQTHSSSATPPLGRPIPGSQVYIVDSAMQPVPVGVCGELLIGGAGLARDYLNHAALSAEKFVPDLFGGEWGGRLYRTGDLARYLPGGEIEFIGRVDDQVKIRGYRIEPAEIEAVLAQHAEVRQCKVLVQDATPGDKRLVAYVVCDEQSPAITQLRGFLKERLPDYMIPAVFVPLAELPLTPSGKVNRKALPKPEQTREQSEQPFVLPRTPIEQQLAGMWSELLGLKQVSIHDNFFDLGGHSLLLTQLASRMRNAMGVEVTLRSLFEAPTVMALAERTEAARQSAARVSLPPITRALREEPLALSFAQERLWFIDQLEPEGAAYNIPRAVRFTGSLHVPALEQSLCELVRRHEVLRTNFVVVDGRPLQHVRRANGVELPLVDLQGLSTAEQEAQAERLVREEARRPFDLRRAPLLRVQLLQLNETRHEFLFTMHHIVSDGWSTALLVREMGALYQACQSGAPSPLPELPIQYADFAVWQREQMQGEVLDAELRYWKEQLAEAPEVLELPTDHGRTRQESFRGATQSFVVSEALTRDLRQLSQQSNTTLFMTLLAAYQTLLYRYTGRRDILVGTPVANRTRLEIEPLIGFFVNTLVLRTKLNGESSFGELLRQEKEVVLGAQAHQELPFERLVQELAPERSLSHAPLFQVMLVLDNMPARRLELPELELQTIGETGATAKFDITLVLSDRESGELAGEIKYNAALFDEATIARLAQSFEVVLSAMVADVEQPLRNVPLLTSEQRRQLLTEWNDTQTDFGAPRCLDELLEIQVKKTPDAVALVYDDEQLTYAELNRRANQLAHHLRSLGVGPEVVVALLVERSALALIGIWGILKAGGGYVPLDASMPAARVTAILTDARPAVLLTQSHLVEDLSALPRIVLLDNWEAIDTESDEAPLRTTMPENLAYVIYTSGSTGSPKGVAVQHRSLANLSAALRQSIYTSFSSPLRVGLNATLTFDASVKQWLQILDGHTLEIIPDDVRLDAREFVRYANVHALEVVDCTPPQLKTLLDVDVETSLQAVLVGGDAIDETLWEELAAHPTISFYNLYGPTECTDVTTARPVSESRPTIGRPLGNVQTYFLDEYAEPVPFGVRGELCIGGAGVARGYLHQPELTADKFIPDAFGTQPGGRLYRSGDSGRYVGEGEIEFIGRVDDQVKIRGYRIEPGEIEAVLAQHAAVRQCKVLLQEVRPDDKRLVAYVVCDEPLDLRNYLKARLPEYMIPAAFVRLEQMPLTRSGKVDRKALPEPKWSERGEAEQRGTQIEQIVAGIFADVLHADEVGVDENFFELGGHSLLAVQVASRVRTALAFELPLRWVFEAPTVRTLSERIEAAQQTGVSLPSITRRLRAEKLPLSFAQERLWFIDQLEPESAAYNIPGGVQLRGWLQVAALEQSLKEIVRRHEALRTSFVEAGGQPVQQIAAEWKLELPLVDLRSLSAGEQQVIAERLRREEARRPFDLRHAPLLRVRLLQLSARQHQFLFTMHHIVSDGWSMNVAVRELVVLYEALHAGERSSLVELPVQYADFAVWQREWQQETILAQLDYWKEQLAAAPEVLELPTDRPRPVLPSYHGGHHSFSLPADLHQSLKQLSRKHDATLFMTMLAAFQTVLYRYTGQTDLMVGTPVANRNRLEIEPLIGFFVNTLVLRTQLHGESTFRELLPQVREVVLGAQAHQELPFERLVQELAPERSLSHAPLFQVMLVLDNTPPRKLELPGLELHTLGEDSPTAKFDLTLVFSTRHESGELGGVIEYNSALFDAPRMARMAEHFSRLLSAVVEDAEQSLARLPLLSAAERHRLLVEWNDTAAEGVNSCMHELVAAQAQLTPEAVAVEFEDETLTYGELNARANQLAHYLRRFGVGPEVLVGLCLEPSLELVVGALGILKAGGAYVPLDPKYPQERLSFMLDDSQAPVIVTRQSNADFTEQGRIVCIDRDWELIARESEDDLHSGVSSDNLAYVIYTSGSTGRPKGAVIQHRSAVELLSWSCQVFGAGELQAVLGSTSICFDLSVFELFVTLSRGGKVVLVADALQLPSLMGREGVTLINTVPSVMAELLRIGGVPHSVQTINLAGEPLSATLVRQLYKQTNVKRVFDLYGPSEDTTYSTYTLRLPDGPVTIGQPIVNTKAYALDSNQELMPSAVAGELYLGGRGLARGYLRRPELTAEKFIPNPFSGGGERLYRTGDLTRHLGDGRLEYLGRRDQQVKLRGFRIELGEIEATINAHAGVRENVVLVREQRLVAYVVREAEQTVSELRSYLSEKLPQYMVPQSFVWLDELPRLPNGKVNRQLLPEPGLERGERDDDSQTGTQIEQIVAGIFADVLQVDEVGVGENFFELGGHSLLAVQVASRVRTALQFELPLRWVFEAPAVRALAERIQGAQQVGISLPPITRALREETLPLSFAQERLWFIDQLQPESAAYNIPGGVQLTGALQVSALDQSLNEIVRRHEALRTSFVAVAGQPAQQIAAELRLELPLVDLQKLTAVEQQVITEQLRREEARRPFDLRCAPLLRVQLLQLSEQQHQFLFTMHHIVSDGWSMNVAVRELVTLYDALHAGQPSPLTALPVQYADFALWQRQHQATAVLEHLDYWKQQLADAPEVLELPTDRPRPLQPTYHGAQQLFTLPASLHQSLKRLSRKHDATLFMTLLAGFQTLLYRYTAHADIVVGTPVANRNRLELEPLIGFFVNTLVLRSQLNEESTFSELLQQVRETVLGAQSHQELPFERLVQELAPERRLSHAPLFQTALMLDNTPPRKLVLPQLELHTIDEDSATAKWDLMLVLSTNRGNGELGGVIEYNTDLFDSTRMARLAEHFSSLLSTVVEDPNGALGQLPLLNAAERHRLLVEWNDTASVCRTCSIHELFADQVRLRPDAVAVVFDNQQISYEELDARANDLAHRLRGLGVGVESSVAICIERSIEMIVGLLGILKAGGIYVPLDANYPSERLSFMLDNSQIAALLVHDKTAAQMSAIHTPQAQLNLDEHKLTNLQPLTIADSFCSGEQLAYIVYTSGSTGQPKGVSIAHQSVVRLVNGADYVRFTPNDVYLQLSSLSFDAITFDVWGALLNGGRLAMMPPGPPSVEELARVLKRDQVTTVFLTTALFNLMVHEQPAALACVPEVLSGGEQYSITHIRNHLAATAAAEVEPHRFIHCYGPTEVTTFSTTEPITTNTPNPATVSIGRPIANTTAYVLDSKLQPVPVGVYGELYLGGLGLARGYYGHSSLTAERFIPGSFSNTPGARLYRTGDIVRQLSDGRIEFFGRTDHQIKLRGFRIELGEIEAALNGHPAVRENVVIARKDGPGEHRLVAYVVPAREQSPAAGELRSYLRDKLPEYMLPSAYVLMAVLPLTPNGKVDRRLLPEPEYNERELQGEGETQIEQIVAGIFADVLGLDQVGVDENFFELGGHSLLAVQVASRVRAAVQFELPLRWVFEAPTVRTLSERIEAAQQTGVSLPSITRRLRAEKLPLSFAQERLWFIDQLEPESAAYNIPGGVQLRGWLQVAALEQSLKEIVRRHEALRTSFVEAGGQPVQQIAAEWKLELPLVDLGLLSAGEQQVIAERLAREEARRPFDLRHAPLLRVRLLQLSARQHQFLFTMHHIVSDGWSMNVAVRELVALYEALHAGEPSSLVELPVQYADFAVWQREWQQETILAQLDYWKEQLAAAPEVLELPTDRPRPVLPSYHGGHQSFSLPADLHQSLKRLSRKHDATLFMTLLAAFQTVLYRYTGQTDLLVGTPVANRNRLEIEPLIGFFVNTLVLRTRLAGEFSFSDVLSRVREVVLGAQAHQELPFERLVQELAPERSLSHAPLFQVMLVLDNTPPRKLELPGLELHTLGEDSATAKFDLTLVFSTRHESGELGAVIEYNSALFDAPRMARMAEHFSRLLSVIVEDAEQSLARLPLLSAPEQHRLLVEWNDTDSIEQVESCVHELVAAQAQLTPEAVVVEFEDETLTYGELNARANQLAHYLRRFGVGPEVLVGLCLEPSLELVVGVLGILKAGGAYVPLDPKYPQERLSFMLDDSQARVIVTRQSNADFTEQGRIVCIDRDWELIARESEDDLQSGVSSDNLAYVIYTSGSTGRPKGAVIQHRSAVELLSWSCQVFGAGELQAVLGSTSICFDLSVFELFVTLSRGGKVVLVADALQLPSLMGREGVTLINTVPSVMAELLRIGGVPHSVQTINLAGEPLSATLVRQLYEQTHVKRVFDLYGPSEDTTYSTYTLRLPDGPVTIGQPIANTKAYALDSNQELMPSAVAGELHLGGRGLARGYLRRPELTAEKFIPNPFSGSGERLYRTGDLTRHLGDGRLEYLGRRDQQVKLRGFRIELGEIETALNAHVAVRETVVLVREQRLVAYVVREAEQTVSELRNYLSEKLPQYMVPQSFVWLDELPRLPNGKVNRQLLPEPGLERGERDDDSQTGTQIEQIVAGIFADVLQVDEVGVNENFFELGGHSLLAVQVASRVRTALQFELPLRWVFEAPAVRALAERIQGAQQTGISLPPLVSADRSMSLPLSFAQERLWFLNQFEPQSAFYNIPIALRLRGPLSLAALESTLNELLRRHEVLRTTFTGVGGKPEQCISAAQPRRLPVIDLIGLTVGQREAAVQNAIREDARAPFDLVLGPVIRQQVLRLSEAEHVVLLTMHHIVSDGWSMGVLVREVAALYEVYGRGEQSSLPELEIQYADFAVWQREWLQGEVLDAELSYWKQQLADAPEVLELPADRARPRLESFRGGAQPLVLSAAVSGGLRELSRRSGTTLFMTLLAAFQTLLYRYTGQTDLLVGTPVANRNRVEIEPLIGFFVNTLVLRTQLHGESTFRELLPQVREVVLGAQAHQELPFERLVQELAPERSLSHAPLFQVMLVLQNTPARRLELPELELQALGEESATAKFDLMLALSNQGGELRGVLEYNRDLFDAPRMERMAEHFSRLLSAVVEDAGQSLARLPLLSAEEQHRLLVEWNQTDSIERVESCVHELVAAQSQLTPEAVALEFEDETLTYAELNARANQLAHYLRRFGVGPEVLVGLCLEPSLELIVGVLGILKAGGAYVPLDPGYPAERLAFMLDDSQARVIVTHKLYADLTDQGRIVCLDRDWELIARESEDTFASGVSPDSLAYVMYTSGSTGIPKGVSVNHRAIVRLVKEPNYVELNASHTFLQLAPVSFDASTFEIWGSLLNGARLALMTGGTPTLQELGAALRRYRVSTLWLTAGLFHLMVDQQLEDLKGLKQLLAGGDVLSVSHVRRFLEEAPGCKLLNGYGPTENTTFTCCHPLTQAATIDSTVPIGRPITSTRVYVLDGELQPVPVGAVGQLYTSGAGLARGYLSRASLTAERFIPNPFSAGERLYQTGDQVRQLEGGTIEFIGRADQQVKLRGFRVELGEIEAALSAHSGVRENVVVMRQDVPGEKRLVAYVVPDEQALEVSELRSFVREKLPEYMVPSAFVLMAALPLNPNGKVNRQLLPEPEPERSTTSEREPGTQIEQILAGIFADVLHVDEVGADENFFELGGHSLLAVQVASRVRTALDHELPLRAIFEAPTIAALAARIEESAAGVSLPPITRALREGPLPLSFAQERLWFIDQLEPESAAYNIPGGVQLRGWLQVAALEQSLREMVRRHEALRTSFVEAGGQPVQQIAAELNLRLSLVDLGLLSASEQQVTAERLAREEARRPFDLRHAPLLRVRLLQFSEQQHQFLFTMHHIVSDGWSMNVAVRELVKLYEALQAGHPSSLTELAVQYADFAVWQREHQEAAVLEQLDYWKQQLAEAPSLDLPADRRRGSEKKHSGQYPIRIPAALSNELISFARRESLTPFMILLAGYQLVLSRYSGQRDISVGTPVAGRDRFEVEELIGFFVNTLVMRTQLEPSWTIREYLKHVRETALQAHMHRDVQFERLVEELQPERRLDRSPLFQVMLAVQPARAAVEWPGLEPRMLAIDSSTAKFDMVLTLVHGEEQISGTLTYNAALFDDTTIARLGQSFEAVLAAMVTDADQPLRKVQLLTSEQRRQLLTEWNDTQTDFGAPRCLDELLEIQVKKTPDAVALVYDDEQLTYAELNRRANQLAHHLRSLGVGPEVVVALLVERSALALIGIWGILKAGGAYVPLDASMPAARVTAILTDARPAVLLTQSHLVEDLSDLPPVVLLDNWEAIDTENDEGPLRTTTPENLAYVIYTSGSTGTPKGVAVQHRSLANLSAALRQGFYTSFSSPVRVGLNATLTFDASVKQWLQVLDGHTLEIIPDDVRLDARQFVKYASAHALDVVDCTPPQLKTLLDVDVETSLQTVLVGGDAIDETLWEELAAHPTISFYNLYGPTECTDVTTARPVSESRPTIGRPLANVQTYFLDEYAEPVPFGVRGELCIGGAGVARGYLHQPELTADKFIPDAFGTQPGGRLYRSGDSGRYVGEGEIEFIGRVDDQVKIRGYRIEPGEIEAVLAQHAAVRQCKVLLQEVRPDDKRLVAYVVCDEPLDLRNYLKARLPEYMIPAAFVRLEQMPLTRSGKVDRKALPKPEQSNDQRPLVLPRTPTEQQLADMWSELLGLKQVGIHDNFFDLGGHSLLLTQLASRMRNTMSVDVPLRSLFESPTILEMGQLLSNWQVTQHDPAELAQLLGEIKNLTPQEIQAQLLELN